MTLAEWTKTVTDELKAAGFEVAEYQGFPLVKPSMSGGIDGHLERVRLLKFTTTVACDRSIYAEGMIFLPAGSNELMRERAERGPL
jgi:hypothetical protein